MSQKSRARARQKNAERHRADTARSAEGVPAYKLGTESEARIDERERHQKPFDDEEAQSEPNRKNRPAVEELVGISEYQIRSASDLAEGDPIASVIAEETQGGEDLYEPQITIGGPRLGPPVEPETVEPDELGAHFLRGAVQDPGPLGDEFRSERAGREVRPRVRAKRIREQSLRVAKQRKTTRRAT